MHAATRADSTSSSACRIERRMTPERVLRFEVPSREVLEKMAQAPLPFGLQAESAQLQFYRVVYYDTIAADLEHRNATVQVRIGEVTQALLVDVRDHNVDDGGIVRRHAESALSAVDPQSIFFGDTEAAQIVRALTDPARLEPSFELEVTRRRRSAKLSDSESGISASFSYDAIVVRRGELTGELYEIEVCLPETKAATFDGLVQAFEAEPNVRITLAETVTRARELLHNIELDRMELQVRATREVAVIAYDRGRVALSPEHGNLRVP